MPPNCKHVTVVRKRDNERLTASYFETPDSRPPLQYYLDDGTELRWSPLGRDDGLVDDDRNGYRLE